MISERLRERLDSFLHDCSLMGEFPRTEQILRLIEGDPTREELTQAAADEAGDVVAYADLLTNYLGIDLGKAVKEKFNRVSMKHRFTERL